MNFILRTAPPFLRKADAYLRVNHSWIWMTKIHIHLYMAVILGAFFSVVGLLYGISLTDVPTLGDQDGFFILLFIPATIFCFYMLFNMSLFNTDKSYAYRFRYQEFFLFLIYFFTFCLPLIVPYSASLILNYRIANLVEDKEFARDKKQYNEGMPFFPIDSYDYSYYPSDSVYLFKTRLQVRDDEQAYEHVEDNSDYKFWEDLRDSVFYHKGVFEKERPKLYYHHTLNWAGEDYSWRHSIFSMRRYDYDYFQAHTGSEADSLFSLYIESINLVHDPKIAARHVSEMNGLFKKYTTDVVINEQMFVDNYVNNYYRQEMDFPVGYIETAIGNTQRNISSINDAKLHFSNAWDTEIHFGIAIFIFCITILFQLFKNVHWKQLLLAAAVGAGLLTLMIVIEVIARTNGRFFVTTAVVLPILFLVISVSGFYIKRFSWLLNVVNIFLTLLLPFYLLMVLGYLDEFHHIFRIEYFDQYKIQVTNAQGYTEWIYNDDYYLLIARIWAVTFISSILSYVLIWNSYLKLLYLRYWSLPKNK